MLGFKSSVQATETLWDLYEEFDALQNELADYQMLMMYANNSSIIVTTTKPVYTVEDLQGLKLRAPSGVASDMVIVWNGTPITMGSADIFQAMEKNTIDDYIFEYTDINIFSLQEVSTYYTEIPFYVGPFLMLMNKSSFEKLPEDLQQILMEESGYETSMLLTQAFYEDGQKIRQLIIDEYDGQMIAVTGEALEGFVATAREYVKNWAIQHSTDSFDAQAYLDRVMSL